MSMSGYPILIALCAVFAALGCGAPPMAVQPAELLARSEAAGTIAERRASLAVLSRHPSVVDREPALLERSGELHAALGDWSAAAERFLRLGERLSAEGRATTSLRALGLLMAAEQPSEARRVAETLGARRDDGPTWALAYWVMGATTDTEHDDGRARLTEALSKHPGDPWLLTASAALALALGEPGRASLLAEQALALDAADATHIAHTVRARALATLDPEAAAGSFSVLAQRHGALSVRAHARFLLAHGRVREAHNQLEVWLTTRPDDDESRRLYERIGYIEQQILAASEEGGQG